MDLFAYRRAAVAAEDNHQEALQSIQNNAFIIQAKEQALKDQRMQNEAIKKYDPTRPETLDLVAADLAKGGDFNGAIAVEDSKSKMLIQAQTLQVDKLKVLGAKSEIAGGVLGAMGESQSSYDSGIMQLMASGTNVYELGLTGRYDEDKGKLPALAKGMMTVYQQATLKEKTIADERANAAAERAVIVEKDKVRHQQAMEKDSNTRANAYAKREEDAAKAARLLQEGKKDAARIRIQKLAKPDTTVLGSAQTLLKDDPRTKQATEGVRGIWKNMLASRTAQAIAARVDPEHPTMDWTPDDYDAEMRKQLDGMIEDGSIKFIKHWWKKDEGIAPGPSASGKLVENPIAPSRREASGKVEGPKVVDPKTLPVGGFTPPMASGKRYKIIGKDKEGYPIVETNPDGSPVSY